MTENTNRQDQGEQPRGRAFDVWQLPGCVLIGGAFVVMSAVIGGVLAILFFIQYGISAGLQALGENEITADLIRAFLLTWVLFGMVMGAFYWLRDRLRSVRGMISLALMAVVVALLVWFFLASGMVDLDQLRSATPGP